jgi:hypothetical protein
MSSPESGIGGSILWKAGRGISAASLAAHLLASVKLPTPIVTWIVQADPDPPLR